MPGNVNIATCRKRASGRREGTTSQLSQMADTPVANPTPQVENTQWLGDTVVIGEGDLSSVHQRAPREGGDPPLQTAADSTTQGEDARWLQDTVVIGEGDLSSVQGRVVGQSGGSDLPLRTPIDSIFRLDDRHQSFEPQSPWAILNASTYRPWIHDYQAGLAGHKNDDCDYPLFDSTVITQPADSEFYRDDRNHYFIDLFFQRRFFNKDTNEARYSKSSPKELSESWTSFILNYSTNPAFWMQGLMAAKNKFMKHSIDGEKMMIHAKCIEEDLPCAVPKTAECPMCYYNSPKLPQTAHIDPENRYYIMSNKLRLMIINFDVRWNMRHCRDDQQNQTLGLSAEESYDEVRMISLQFANSDLQLKMARMMQEFQHLRSQVNSLRTKQDQVESNVDGLVRVVHGKRKKGRQE